MVIGVIQEVKKNFQKNLLQLRPPLCDPFHYFIEVGTVHFTKHT